MKSLITLIFTLCCISTAFATDYYFHAHTDHQFTNPANWSPAYPGDQIADGDRVFLEDDAVFEGYSLEVFGSLEVGLHTSLTSTTGEIHVKETGVLRSYGVVRAKGMRVWGTLYHNTGANLRVRFMSVRATGLVSNLPGANMFIMGDMALVGHIRNYADIQVGETLHLFDASRFHQLGTATLRVRTGLQQAPQASFVQERHTLSDIPKSTIATRDRK